MNINSGLTTAAITGTITATQALPAASGTQTLVNASWNSLATGGTAYTVTAGKTFYCLGFIISCGAASIMEIKVAGTTKICFSGGTNVPCAATGGILFTAAATQAITIASSGAATYGALYGYEA